MSHWQNWKNIFADLKNFIRRRKTAAGTQSAAPEPQPPSDPKAEKPWGQIAKIALTGITAGLGVVLAAWIVQTLPILGLLLPILLVRPHIVRQDERWVIERFGKCTRTLQPGLQFTIWGAHAVRAKISTREHFKADEVEGTITGGSIAAPTAGEKPAAMAIKIEKINYALRTKLDLSRKDSARLLTYALSIEGTKDPREAVDMALGALVDATIRAIIGGHEFSYVWSNQSTVRDEIQAGLKKDLERWGLEFINLDITEIVPPQDVIKLMRAPYEASQRAEANIQTARGEAETIKLTAHAHKEREIAEATAEATAVEREAEAKAKSFGIMAKSLGFEEREGNSERNKWAFQKAFEALYADNVIEAWKAALEKNSKFVLLGSGGPADMLNAWLASTLGEKLGVPVQLGKPGGEGPANPAPPTSQAA